MEFRRWLFRSSLSGIAISYAVINPELFLSSPEPTLLVTVQADFLDLEVPGAIDPGETRTSFHRRQGDGDARPAIGRSSPPVCITPPALTVSGVATRYRKSVL